MWIRKYIKINVFGLKKYECINDERKIEMYFKKQIGKEGEDIAEKYLLANGYKIIDRNFYARQGEIDIIAKEKNEWVFIEVKTRTNDIYGKPIDAVDSIKQKHLIKTINYYIYSNKLENERIRVDVIEVYKVKEKYVINHIKQVI